MVGRKVPEPLLIECACLSSDKQFFLARAFICHILYMRGLTSSTLNYVNLSSEQGLFLDEMVDDSPNDCQRRPSSRLKLQNRRRDRAKQGINTTFRDLELLFRDERVGAVSLLLGASAIQPREAYTLHFLHTRVLQPATEDKTVLACMRLLVRKLVQQWSCIPPPAQRLSAFVAVRPAMATVAPGLRKMYESFTVKQGFRIRAPKRNVPAVHVLAHPRIQPPTGQPPAPSPHLTPPPMARTEQRTTGDMNTVGTDEEDPVMKCAEASFWFVSKKALRQVL